MSQPMPDSAKRWVRLSVALIEAGQARSAPRYFAEAARLEPRNAQAVPAKNGHMVDAAATLRRIVADVQDSAHPQRG
jgi:hypothetical protein